MGQRKVIFFTLNSGVVFRNLFFFPNSVFDQIKTLTISQNIKVVLVMDDAANKMYYEHFKPLLNENFVVEKVGFSYKKTFLQKCFYFFYSYLIYTKTTKLLATMGLRPDEPPAGGKWYLNPVKKIIAGTFGRSFYFKTKAVPYLYKLFYRENYFTQLFEKYKPVAIFVPHIYGQMDVKMLSEAQERKVKTIGMAAGWDHLDKYFLPFRPDKLLAQSNHVYDMALKYQCYKENQVEIVGYPHLDFVSDPKYAQDRSEFLKGMKMPENAKFVFYISGSAYCPDEPDVIETILKWIDEGKFGPNTYLLIRPYLGGRGADRDFDKAKFESFEKHPHVRFWTRENWFDVPNSVNFMNMLLHSSAVISIFTTAVLEAAVFDVPLITTVFDGYNIRPYHRSIRRFLMSEHFQDVIDTKAMKITHSFDELFDAIEIYMKNPKLDSDQRQVLRDKLLYKLDGKASKRVIDNIYNLIQC